jgi:hypothetical protein
VSMSIRKDRKQIEEEEKESIRRECGRNELARVVNSNTSCALSIVGLALSLRNTTILFLDWTTMLRTVGVGNGSLRSCRSSRRLFLLFSERFDRCRWTVAGRRIRESLLIIAPSLVNATASGEESLNE